MRLLQWNTVSPLYSQMWSLQIWRAHCTAPFRTTTWTSSEFGIRGASRNRPCHLHQGKRVCIVFYFEEYYLVLSSWHFREMGRWEANSSPSLGSLVAELRQESRPLDTSLVLFQLEHSAPWDARLKNRKARGQAGWMSATARATSDGRQLKCHRDSSKWL